jgi:hypothetical protein
MRGAVVVTYQLKAVIPAAVARVKRCTRRKSAGETHDRDDGSSGNETWKS